MECGKESFGQLVIAGGDTAKLFELVKEALDAVAASIEELVASQFFAARADRRDHRLNAVAGQTLADAIGIVAFVERG